MQALFFTVFAIGGFGALGSKRSENPSPCWDIVEDAESSPDLVDEERAHIALTQCKTRQLKTDCREFARLYQLARHYSQKGVVPADFCSTLEGYSNSDDLATDSRTMGHRACVAGMSKVFGNPQLGEAAEQVCLRNYAGLTNAARVCRKLSSVLPETSDDGTLDTSRLCDRLLAGGNGTRRLDKDHFLYSCVQYASNVVADSTGDRLLLAAQEVQNSCHKHFSVAGQGEFCSGYANLVRMHATESEISRFCGAQYQTLDGATQRVRHADTAQTAVGMTAICQHSASQVAAAGVELGTLQRSAQKVCVTQFHAMAPKASQKQVYAGCRFFAKHLSDEVKRTGGVMDIPTFCESLAGRTKEPSKRPVPQRQSQEPPKVHIDEESLRGFLSAFDVAPQDKGVVNLSHPSEVEQLPQDASTSEPLVTPPTVQGDARLTFNQPSSSFLRPVTPHRVEPLKSQAALQTSPVSVQPDSGDGTEDIDTLVSLFQS